MLFIGKPKTWPPYMRNPSPIRAKTPDAGVRERNYPTFEWSEILNGLRMNPQNQISGCHGTTLKGMQCQIHVQKNVFNPSAVAQKQKELASQQEAKETKKREKDAASAARTEKKAKRAEEAAKKRLERESARAAKMAQNEQEKAARLAAKAAAKVEMAKKTKKRKRSQSLDDEEP